MNILAIDTATEACSVALLKGEEAFSTFEICPQQHSQRILPMIDDLLKKQDIKLKELDAIAYGRGPGSFTGVRIATGIAQGLAFGAELPVLQISTLAAMAQEAYEKTGVAHVRVLIDARMQEVYFGDYVAVNGLVEARQEEAVLPPNEAFEKFESEHAQGEQYTFAGTGWQAYASDLHFSSSIEVLYPNAKAMLKLAKQAYLSAQTVKAEEIQPTYLRDKVTWKKLPNKE
ncbi:tRNA (adenosine(37)-N6)-threonylcarbamoyltransferase complex dimerization subunit type 1 TsaB [Glaciecola sp. KUL10]|uniref:tRNA (adenosine(37)-N6)-threonylcarbamoyltransferase complex dimerization subunit type 1 TsaB n=1 Tax=Glaciecola sp. (strain KUL10) TaxID=2161813 RepID=UPI000D782AC6|nr:tRNA (adenosine(37)-N6)-threonylcarbamoyltransferase complex dimerization subunit type 1 TsaB [Glaciecola sp. KUL10]GBL03444.1 hypothetical protein KUL10_07320 [Glaciecola sp. KUL10]